MQNLMSTITMRNRQITSRLTALLPILALALALLPSLAQAAPVSHEQALAAATRWLDATPEHLTLRAAGKRLLRAETATDDTGRTLYHVVRFAQDGTDDDNTADSVVVLAGDDRLEPVVLFGSGGGGLDDGAPAADILARALGARLDALALRTRIGETATRHPKWAYLLGDSDGGSGDDTARAETMLTDASYLSDLRVTPLLTTTWHQGDAAGDHCYNYYTPNHYPSGCVATAMGQLMRFHQHPTQGVGNKSFLISSDDIYSMAPLLGGDGLGGSYEWSLMPEAPATLTGEEGMETLSDAQRQAIGALLADAGASVNMNYTEDGAYTDTLLSASSLRDTFGYANAVQGYNGGWNMPAESLRKMANTNLDAGLPVLFGITGNFGGHAIVGDGYGYDGSTMYYHLNMGWSGSWNYWYAVPYIIDLDGGGFSELYKVVYNVFPEGEGEIISGRVTNTEDKPVYGATVTAQCGDAGVFQDTTDAYGVYGLLPIPSETTCDIHVSRDGYAFSQANATTGTSGESDTVSGNVWAMDFQARAANVLPALHLLMLD